MHRNYAQSLDLAERIRETNNSIARPSLTGLVTKQVFTFHFPGDPESRAQGIFIQNQAGTPGAPPREPEDPGNILQHYSNPLARKS